MARPDLTARQLEVLSEVVKGATNKQIAATLQISVETVKRHLVDVGNKLGSGSRVTMAFIAVQQRLVLLHGTRAQYYRGCACHLCRAANAAYSVKRYGKQVAKKVPAEPVRRHIVSLAERGVGFRAIAAACDVSLSTLKEIKNGISGTVYASTAERILRVSPDALSDGAGVSAEQVRKHMLYLVREGYTKLDIAHRLGRTTPLQIRKSGKVRAITASKVERLYRQALG